jgi:hypothetical protein
LVVFVFTFGGALAGMRLRESLPGHHLSDDSKDTIKLGIGLIATMTALVLGLVTASAKGAFDVLDRTVKQGAEDMLTLDRTLARYGPETGEIRAELKDAVGRRIALTWPEDPARSDPLDPSALLKSSEAIADQIRALKPQNDAQRYLQSRATDLAEGVLEARWMGLGGGSTSIPPLFRGVLLLWLTVIFASFGLFAPRNATVLAVLAVCALSVAGAVFLITELDKPFDGLLKVSAEPMRFAYAHLNQ